MLKPKQEFFAKSVSQIINEQRGIFFCSAAPGARMAMTRRVHPLLSLNAYQGSWTIKVRVTNKGVLRTYKNARGEGCVFNVELTDEEGTEIQETMFNAAARKSYDTFQKGKLANKQFKTVHNDYEMTLNEYEAGSEEMFITETKFNFVPIDELLMSSVVSLERFGDFKVQSSIFVFHYPLSKAAKLKSWYDSEGIETYMSAIVSGMSPSANKGSRSMYSDRVCLSHFTTNPSLGEELPVFFSTRAYISFIKPDQEGEANEFQTKLKEATWSSHLFHVSVSQQEYNIEKRQRITVRRVSPIDFAAKTRLLLQDVSKNKKTSQ
ncbi:BnaC01g43370D [Brassica napus]|uniref:BnaC01g43370D protein n=1 Tax=Brassica napus TaxID=3708 RepID=A0A078IHE0_BRANA|nr:BnaC01g43370D [Brassica napus]